MRILPNGLKKIAIRKKTTFEWDIEQADEFGDIQDHSPAKKLSDYPVSEIVPAIKSGNFALVKNVWIDYGDGVTGELDSKAWAYVSEGKLPTEFDDGSQVPLKYANEFNLFLQTGALDQ